MAMAEPPGESRLESAAPRLTSTVWGDRRDYSDTDAGDASSSQTLPQRGGEPDAWRDGVERSPRSREQGWGNIGIFCCNFGRNPSVKKQGGLAMRDHIWCNLITNPCRIIGMCECQLLPEKALNEGLVSLPPTAAVAVSFLADRAETSNSGILTIRPREEASNLIGVRAELWNDIQCLAWDAVTQK